VITTTHNRPKPFAWSYSKLKNFDTCPLRHLKVDVQKEFKEDESEQLRWGNALHKGLADRLGKKVALPSTMAAYEPMIQRLEQVPGEALVECKFAINDSFGPVEFFDRAAWFRGIADVLILNAPVALAIDYKTGKVVEDSQQLALMAACVFAHFPAIMAIRTEFWWLKEDATSRQDFRRQDMPDMWRALWPRVQALKRANETMTYPPKPGGLCRNHCPVITCPSHGK